LHPDRQVREKALNFGFAHFLGMALVLKKIEKIEIASPITGNIATVSKMQFISIYTQSFSII
jgi:hypothetical protein